MTFEIRMTTAEKIATVVDCFLSHGTTEGKCGTLVKFDGGPVEFPYRPGYRVIADGKCFIVRTNQIGWEVDFKGFKGIAPDLEYAATLAFDGGAPHNVSTMEDCL